MPCPIGDCLPLTFTHLTVRKKAICLQFIPLFSLSNALGYLYATYRSYTQISLLHGKKDYWYFKGLPAAPPAFNLTLIQQMLLTPASITPSTHTLPLLAMIDALHRRFGVPPSPSSKSPYLTQSTIRKYPCFVCPDLFSTPQLAGLANLH